MSLEKKVILVAGAGGLIGKCVVHAALQAGATVVATDVQLGKLKEVFLDLPSSDRLLLEEMDIGCADSIVELFESVCERLGRIDGAVNLAYPRNKSYGKSFLDVENKDFCENVSIHLGGYFTFMQRCVKYAMETQSAFSLINFSSIYGVVAPKFDIYAGTEMTMPVEYAAIKAGLQHLSVYASAYTKNTSFRVNCISPGGVYAGQDKNFLARYREHCRSKGMLDPQDITGTVIFLLSDESKYICGQNIVIDDGFSI